ncbi:MAG: hypothetical protein ACOCXA_02935 [Planctomycetota bacterium]
MDHLIWLRVPLALLLVAHLASSEPTILPDSIPDDQQRFAVAWQDENGQDRVKQIDFDQLMALVDVTANEQSAINRTFALEERLLELQWRRRTLASKRGEADFDAVLWQRLDRERQRLQKALGRYHSAVRNAQGRTYVQHAHQQLAFYRPTGDPDRDRKRVLGPPAEPDEAPTTR